MDTLAYSGSFPERAKLQGYAGQGLARLRIQEALNALAVASVVLLACLAILIFLDRYLSLAQMGINVWVIWAGLAVLSIPYILWRVYSPRIHQNLAAVLADERLGLHARLCTGLTLDMSDPSAGAFGAAFYAEALDRLGRLDIAHAFPVRRPRAAPFMLLPGALAAGLYFFMPYQDALGLIAQHEQKRKAEARREAVGTKLEQKLEDLKNRKTGADGEADATQYKAKQIIEKAENVAKDLKDGQRSKEEAMLALGQIKRDIQDQKDKLAEGKEFLDRLEKLKANKLNLEDSALTRDISQALKNADPGLAARELRKLAQKVKDDILDDPNKTPEQKKEALDKLKREVEKLASALAEDEDLRKNLQELSRNTMSASEYEGLREEIKKERDRQGKGSKKLGDDIQKQLEQAADELERLEEDNDAALSEDDEKEMESLEEAEEGVDEAMQGLSAEEELEGDCQNGQCQGGQPGGKQGEGKKAGQGGEKKAGKKVSKGQKRGSAGKQGGQSGKQDGQGQGQGREGRKNGQPGNGLGGGKGEGRRPYRDGEAEFKQEKVRGQLQQGAITGLSHFRGQGAKGDAPSEFVNAMQSAEQEANSPLELERIPNDAREVVKDYFTKVHDGARLPAAPKKAQPATFDGTKPDPAPKGETLKE